jgi:hypothetical protein
MTRISKALTDRIVLVLFGLSVLAMLAAAGWAPYYIAHADQKGPALVALFLGLFLGCNGGILIVGILAANARQEACADAHREGYRQGMEAGQIVGKRSALMAMGQELRRRHLVETDQAAGGT